MPHFDIVKESHVENTFRVARVASDFDLDTKRIKEHFVGDIDLPQTWSIGCIVGGSGTGKSTIANELFGDDVITSFEYTRASVIDDMPQSLGFEDISRLFYSTGFGSVPSWLKPYHVLSNGEKMRVDLARAMGERDFIVFDEFTSVVDRQVASTACIAINKSVRRSGKQFVAITCHYDVLDWLEPDWVFNTDTMAFTLPTDAQRKKKDSQSENAPTTSGRDLAVIII